jgi:putative PEP-CTERM system TPR-repeat lipoprotein
LRSRPFKKPAPRRLAAVVTAAAVVALLAACGGESERELVASAKSYIEKKDNKAAIIQLKSALQQQPQSAEARFLLGETLFKSGDVASAVVELEKAHDLKHPDDEVLPVLAQALLSMGQAKKVTDLYSRVTLTDPKAAAELKAVVASAFSAQGLRERSEAATDMAIGLDPANVKARLLQARHIATQGDIDKALTLVDALMADEPKRIEAHQLKGELLWLGRRDLPGAAQSFRAALELDPRSLTAHTSLIAVLLQQRDAQGFKDQVAELKKVLPNHPETLFYDTQLALIDKDLKRAREGSQQLLKVLPDNFRVLQLAGAVEFQAGSLLLAESHLAKAVQLSPNLPLARRLLAETHLRSGQPAKALATLQPALERPQPGGEVLALAAQAHLQLGDAAKAESLFNQAAKLNPNDAKVQTALALTQISKGNAEGGFAQLETLASSDPGTYADLALISARLRSNDLEGALKAIDRLQAKQADKAVPHQLRGRVLAQRKDLAGARASFDKALAIDPVYFPAVAGLAGLDIAEKRPEDALKRFEALLAREPKNYRALLAVAELKQSSGAKPEEVAKLLADAVKASPTDAEPRLLQIEHHLLQKNVKAAREAAEDAVAAVPDNVVLLDALGRTQLASGEVQQAITAFRKAAAAQPNLPQPQLRLADAYVAAKDLPAAAQSLRRALELSPRLLAAQRGLVLVALADKRPADALAVARTVQNERPTEAIGWLLETDVHASQRDFDPGITSMRGALERAKSTDHAIRLHAMYAIAGRNADADRFAAQWTKEQPKDALFVFHLGSMAMDKKDYAGAEARYRQVLALTPDQPLALNNVAWLMVQQGKPGAVVYAEKAQKLLPEQASVMDTLASALAAEKQLPLAIEWQRKAVLKAPNNPTYQLGLAKLLIKSGDKTAARGQLEQLGKLGDKFAAQAEVTQLLNSLQ